MMDEFFFCSFVIQTMFYRHATTALWIWQFKFIGNFNTIYHFKREFTPIAVSLFKDTAPKSMNNKGINTGP